MVDLNQAGNRSPTQGPEVRASAGGPQTGSPPILPGGLTMSDMEFVHEALIYIALYLSGILTGFVIDNIHDYFDKGGGNGHGKFA